MATARDAAQAALLRRGFVLEYVTLAWNVVDVVILAIATVSARSVALAGFGLDSLIEIGASTVVIWELSGTGEPVTDCSEVQRASSRSPSGVVREPIPRLFLDVWRLRVRVEREVRTALQDDERAVGQRIVRTHRELRAATWISDETRSGWRTARRYADGPPPDHARTPARSTPSASITAASRSASWSIDVSAASSGVPR